MDRLHHRRHHRQKELRRQKEEEDEQRARDVEAEERLVQLQAPGEEDGVQVPHVVVGEPVRGEEVGAMAQLVAEADGVDGDGGVLEDAAAVETPVELLVPHGVGEVDEVHVATDIGTTSQRKSARTQRTQGRQE